MLQLVGLGGLNLFGLALDYIVAGGLIVGGFYLFGSFRWLGLVVIVAGSIVGAVAYGRSLQAADCIAAGRLAAVEIKLATAERDLAGWKLAAELRAAQLRGLNQQKDKADARIATWEKVAGGLTADLRRCRSATRDDDRRLCEIIGYKAAGCTAAR